MTSTTISKTRFLPYGRQHIEEDDIEAVVAVLKSDWLTQGPEIERFEEALARRVGAPHAIACSSGTAALHLSMMALGLGPGDSVVTSPISFLASANCARYVGADVRFADIDPATGLMDPEALERVLEDDPEHHIKAVIPVDLAGQPADIPNIKRLADVHGAWVVEDACHAIGAWYDHGNERFLVGSGRHSMLTAFSFHPVKHVAMGEGGAVTTADPALAERLRLFRNHGMKKSDFACEKLALSADGSPNPWYYEMQEIGFNYRTTDIHAALGLSQLRKLNRSISERQRIADTYRVCLAEMFANGEVLPLETVPGAQHAYHLFVVKIDFDSMVVSRAELMHRLREAGIGSQVHYIPIHLQPYYQNQYGTGRRDFPGAEAYYQQALSLPMFPGLTDDDIRNIVTTLREILTGEV